ncbi:transporter substrate-binding domain-containing protein [Luteolibacter ambystomatis]|uniref:Transporter substrate-binding domain-containing protein n=1 Tax=Luteolibacter ambystomatis TaxID=2824561 RepID=A0A975G7Z5_9BACT|nr:transporter substrate-binding domain-containing protein [Luteolibacter ambystomatis]QUE51019.1 transporter substrate-binding domain-containing protein [Luteolibacter ambystomatis]
MRRLFTLALALLLTACQKPAADAGTGGALRVGMELTYPPFEMQDASGKPDGVGVKLAEALAKDLGRPVRIVPMEFSGLIPALKSGSVDVVISSMTATDERRQSIDFSEPYAFTGLALLVGKNSDIQSIDDLKKPGRKLAVKASTTGESRAAILLPDAKRTAYTEETACVQEVAQGRADAFIYDQLSIFRYQKNNAATTRALLKPFVEESWAVGIAKGNDTLKEQVNAFIEKFRKDGGFAKLGDQYLSEEKQFLESQGIPFILR